MKHGWEEIASDGLLTPRKRRCRICGAEQERTTQHAWMRVTGYRWLPLAGRCKQMTTNAEILEKAEIWLADAYGERLAAMTGERQRLFEKREMLAAFIGGAARK